MGYLGPSAIVQLWPAHAAIHTAIQYVRGVYSSSDGRFSRHKICVASEKRGRVEEKNGARKGREYFQRCWGRFQQCYVLKTFPSTLKDEDQGRKKGERGRKRCAGKGREYFQTCWGRFSIMLRVENLPKPLKR